jgi:hypothetical protein
MINKYGQAYYSLFSHLQGHFGPMGIGAIFISTLASTKLPEPVYPPTNQVELLADVIQPIVHFIVLGCVSNLFSFVSLSVAILTPSPYFFLS